MMVRFASPGRLSDCCLFPQVKLRVLCLIAVRFARPGRLSDCCPFPEVKLRAFFLIVVRFACPGRLSDPPLVVCLIVVRFPK